MPTFSTIPVIEASYQFVIAIHNLCEKFPKKDKIHITNKIIEHAHSILDHSILINAAKSLPARLELFASLRPIVVTLTLKLRIARDLKMISLGQFTSIHLSLTEIKKQLRGWYQWTERENQKLQGTK